MADNGLGIAPERLEATRKNMYEGSDDPDADIGLRNVYMRLKYFLWREVLLWKSGITRREGRVISVFIPTQAGKEGNCCIH